MTQLIHQDLSYAVRGVLFDVYNKLGPLLPERFYQEAIEFGLTKRGVTCEKEKEFEVYYRGERVGLYYVDLWVEGGKLLLELKVAPEIRPVHRAQAISYLKVTDADLALVANFGAASVQAERLPNFLRNKIVKFEWEQRPITEEMLYPELTGRLLEVLHRVHFELGPGFLHRLYRRATMVELREQGLHYEYIKEVPIYYGDHYLGQQEARLIQVEDRVLVAAVGVKQADQTMQGELGARLRHLGLRLGLLANFNSTTLQVTVVRR